MSKEARTAPAIKAEGIDEYLLENGNTISKEAYDRMWNPQKGQVRRKAYGIIGRQIPNHLKNKKS